MRAYSHQGHGPRADQTGRIHISDFRNLRTISLAKCSRSIHKGHKQTWQRDDGMSTFASETCAWPDKSTKGHFRAHAAQQTAAIRSPHRHGDDRWTQLDCKSLRWWIIRCRYETDAALKVTQPLCSSWRR